VDGRVLLGHAFHVIKGNPDTIDEKGRGDIFKTQEVTVGKKGDSVVLTVRKGIGEKNRFAAPKLSFRTDIRGEARGQNIPLGQAEGALFRGRFFKKSGNLRSLVQAKAVWEDPGCHLVKKVPTHLKMELF
jgi:hypothetical protein